MIPKAPSEDLEQKVVVHWLRLHGILHHHGNRKGQRNVQHIMNEERLGSTKGFPDLLIFDPPPHDREKMFRRVGVAIEMKRIKGGKVSVEQNEWLVNLMNRGWAVRVCCGAGDAIAYLESLGFGKRR